MILISLVLLWSCCSLCIRWKRISFFESAKEPFPNTGFQTPPERTQPDHDRAMRHPLVAASALDDSRLDPRKTPEAHAAAAHADRRIVAFDPAPEYPRPERPTPTYPGCRRRRELFLSVQLELVQRFRPHLPSKAVELLTVHTNDVAQIAVPPENRAEHVVKFVEGHLIGDRDQANDHRAHLAQNRLQNQEEGVLTISPDYSNRPAPTFGALGIFGNLLHPARLRIVRRLQ